MLKYVLPLAEIVQDFYDELKSRSSGYASFDYEDHGYEESDLVKVKKKKQILDQFIIHFLNIMRNKKKLDQFITYLFSKYKYMFYSFYFIQMSVLLNSKPVDALSVILHRSQVDLVGRDWVKRLKNVIQRQLFDVVIQTAIGSKIIARET